MKEVTPVRRGTLTRQEIRANGAIQHKLFSRRSILPTGNLATLRGQPFDFVVTAAVTQPMPERHRTHDHFLC
ncbi:hypothetical protein [[Mycobacterium] crassicus]|uniref:Uncharacterized protein n=1 Tax=[Mycobacterium] crassicus TaxID=2872309 RepID=A0ABU5XJV8_9MYCO|nr:hypothetical protein [Mycolicibacter sp. MYC098]MEB3022486.1 hypothetical protein [Mycolicibacter sp. MYC098]